MPHGKPGIGEIFPGMPENFCGMRDLLFCMREKKPGRREKKSTMQFIFSCMRGKKSGLREKKSCMPFFLSSLREKKSGMRDVVPKGQEKVFGGAFFKNTLSKVLSIIHGLTIGYATGKNIMRKSLSQNGLDAVQPVAQGA